LTIVVVGGFLGAGKTTLIFAAARELERRGLKAAVVLNDQGESLVDTQMARQQGLAAEEVTGGCFCCNYSSLVEGIEALRAYAPDVIFAEPVGSCTDISATVLYPLREAYRLAPFTVCVDRAQEANYLYENQLAEADLVVYTKADLYGVRDGRSVSGKTGQGVAAWLDEVLFGSLPVGSKTLDIDYAEYARAEAELTWLNLSARIECDPPVSPSMLLGPMMDAIAAKLEIVHLKATDRSESGFVKAAVANGHEEVEGALDASPARWHEVLINLRTSGDPEMVRGVVEGTLPGRVVERQVACFRPSAPRRFGVGGTYEHE